MVRWSLHLRSFSGSALRNNTVCRKQDSVIIEVTSDFKKSSGIWIALQNSAKSRQDSWIFYSYIKQWLEIRCPPWAFLLKPLWCYAKLQPRLWEITALNCYVLWLALLRDCTISEYYCLLKKTCVSVCVSVCVSMCVCAHTHVSIQSYQWETKEFKKNPEDISLLLSSRKARKCTQTGKCVCHIWWCRVYTAECLSSYN